MLKIFPYFKRFSRQKKLEITWIYLIIRFRRSYIYYKYYLSTYIHLATFFYFRAFSEDSIPRKTTSRFEVRISGLSQVLYNIPPILLRQTAKSYSSFYIYYISIESMLWFMFFSRFGYGKNILYRYFEYW